MSRDNEDFIKTLMEVANDHHLSMYVTGLLTVQMSWPIGRPERTCVCVGMLNAAPQIITCCLVLRSG